MYLVFLVAHFILALCLIGIVLLQRTSSDGLGGLSGSSSQALMSGRASANFLTRLTTIIAALFMVNSLILANLATRQVKERSIFENTIEAPAKDASPKGQKDKASKPAKPVKPSVPVAE